MCTPAAAVDSHAGSVPEQTGGRAAPILSAKGPELWYCREQGTALLGKGLVVMAGQEFVPVKPQKRTVSDMVFTF